MSNKRFTIVKIFLDKDATSRLETEVNKKMEEGYMPQGIPFLLQEQEGKNSFLCQTMLLQSRSVLKLDVTDITPEGMEELRRLFQQPGTILHPGSGS